MTETIYDYMQKSAGFAPRVADPAPPPSPTADDVTQAIMADYFARVKDGRERQRTPAGAKTFGQVCASVLVPATGKLTTDPITMPGNHPMRRHFRAEDVTYP